MCAMIEKLRMRSAGNDIVERTGLS
jgi:hypothetical protein